MASMARGPAINRRAPANVTFCGWSACGPMRYRAAKRSAWLPCRVPCGKALHRGRWLMHGCLCFASGRESFAHHCGPHRAAGQSHPLAESLLGWPRLPAACHQPRNTRMKAEPLPSAAPVTCGSTPRLTKQRNRRSNSIRSTKCRSERIEKKACNSRARRRRSGGMESRPNGE